MKKSISLLLTSVMLVGCLSGCKKIEETQASSFGAATVETTTSQTTVASIETQLEVVTDVTKYINATYNNFPRLGEVNDDIFTRIKESVQNEDCSWQVYSNNTAISFNFNSDIDSETPMLNKIMYTEYELDVTDESNPIFKSLKNGETSAVGTVFIYAGKDKEKAMEFYKTACACVTNIYSKEATTEEKDTYISYTLNDDNGNPVAIVALDYPNENIKVYTLTISLKKVV